MEVVYQITLKAQTLLEQEKLGELYNILHPHPKSICLRRPELALADAEYRRAKPFLRRNGLIPFLIEPRMEEFVSKAKTTRR